MAAGLYGCAGGTPDGKPAPFEPSTVIEKKVLTGPEGVRVRLAQTDTSALIELTRVREDVDGAVLLSELGGSTADRFYLTEIDGRSARLVGRKNRDWQLYLGGPIRLEVDEAASAALEPRELIDLHVRQRSRGRLAALARFDRDGAKTRAEGQLAETMARVEKACGFVPDTSIDWGPLQDAELMRYSVAGYCDAPRGALERACRYPELRAFLNQAVSRYVCRFGAAPSLELAGGSLVFTVHFDTPNQDAWAREALDRVAVDGGRTIRRVRIETETTVCAEPEGEGRVVVGPAEDEATAGIAYGREGVLYRQPARPFLPEGWFFEPRYPNPTHNPSFRGYDLRLYSFIEVDRDEKVCLLRCGPREIPLKELVGAEKRALLETARWENIPNPREPYALARDKRGTYYFVDRGATPETARDFRLFIGLQGRLQLQKMRDIVSDSEGEIFASTNGRLKLYLGREDAEWLSRGRVRKLVRVKVEENLALIYNRLGVYLGTPLYTPCDDL